MVGSLYCVFRPYRMHLLCIGKTSHSLNFKWRAVIKNNRMCRASGDLHATASDGREEAVQPGSTQRPGVHSQTLQHCIMLVHGCHFITIAWLMTATWQPVNINIWQKVAAGFEASRPDSPSGRTTVEAAAGAGCSDNKQAVKLLHHLLCWGVSWLESCCSGSLWKIKTNCENGGKKKEADSSKSLQEPRWLSPPNHHAQEQLVSFHTHSDRQISVNDRSLVPGRSTMCLHSPGNYPEL